MRGPNKREIRLSHRPSNLVRQPFALAAKVIVARLGLLYRKSLDRIGLAIRMRMPKIGLSLLGDTTPIFDHFIYLQERNIRLAQVRSITLGIDNGPLLSFHPLRTPTSVRRVKGAGSLNRSPY